MRQCAHQLARNWVLAHRVTLPRVWGREQCVEVELGASLIIDPQHTCIGPVKGRHQKKTRFFWSFSERGGGLPESKISLEEKTEIFLDFFWQKGEKGGGSHLFQKGFIIKY